MEMKIWIVAALITLAGCEGIADTDAIDCLDYGFQPRTDAFAQCRQNAAMNRQQMNNAVISGAISRPRPVNCVRIGPTVSCQ
jgi:hypothetical protein